MCIFSQLRSPKELAVERGIYAVVPLATNWTQVNLVDVKFFESFQALRKSQRRHIKRVTGFNKGRGNEAGRGEGRV